jgi:type I restriction enzyme, R subunit
VSSAFPSGASAAAQQDALRQLSALGWNLLTAQQAHALRAGSEREVLLRTRLVEMLQSRRFDYKGQSHALSAQGIEQILHAVQSLGMSEGLLPANERFYQLLTLGVTVREFMPDGKIHQPTIALIDWDDPSRNALDAVGAMPVLSAQGTHRRMPCVVAFVNGLPLAVLDVQAPGAGATAMEALGESMRRHLEQQRHDDIPQLYAYAQLLLASSGVAARYGTTATPPRFWARWREEEFTAAPRPSSEQDELLRALLSPARLLELLRVFVLFDRKRGKVVARYPQFFGIRALLARLGQRAPDGTREGGVVWHSAGSGKSFTMVFLAKALALHAATQACRILVVTDRIDLQAQLARNFASGGAFGSALATRRHGERARTQSARDLALRIGQGSERILFALVQKFIAASHLPECRNDSPDIVILVDESHRSHGGEAHVRMRRVLPRAACIAFTGTPLLQREKAVARFGAIVHAYPMQRAVDDGAVVPLLYEERMPPDPADAAACSRWIEQILAGLPATQRAELERRLATQGATLDRLELIAWDLALHFHALRQQLGCGIKGQLATASKSEAVRYHAILQAMGLVRSAVVMSAPATPEGDTGADAQRHADLLRWWHDHVGRDSQAYEARVLSGFASDGAPDLLIVVDRLLTGFDEPRNTVLYIDKPLKEHNLLQAVARVNRLHDAKREGLLVDYRGILKALDTAMRAYQDLQARTQGGYDLDDIDGLYRQLREECQQLPALHAALWALFSQVQPPRDAQACRQLLMPRLVEGEPFAHDARRAAREQFYMALARFEHCLLTALSSRSFREDAGHFAQVVPRYQQDLEFFTELRDVVRRDAWHAAPALAPVAREPQADYLPPPRPSGREDPACWDEETTRSEAALLRTRLQRVIDQELAEDPLAQQVFGERLRQVQAQAEFATPRAQHALFLSLQAQLKDRTVPGTPDTLAGDAVARACHGICRLIMGDDAVAALADGGVPLARTMEEAVRRAIAEHALNATNVEAAIRKALLPHLFAQMGGLEAAGAALDLLVHITQRRLARGGA